MLEKKVKEIFAEILETTPESIIDDNMANYGLNSFKALEMASRLEQEFEVQVPEESMYKFGSFQDTIEVINNLKKGN